MTRERASTLAFMLSAVLALAACVSSVPPPGLVPTGPPVTRAEDLSGDYCYYGLDYNVRSFGWSVDAIPFVRIDDLGTPTLVSVEVTAQRIVFRYTGRDGAQQTQDFEVTGKAVWQGASLVVERSEGTSVLPIPGAFDITSHSRKSRIFKLTDGRLVMTDSVRSKGYSETGTHSLSGTGMHSETKPTFHRQERTVAVILEPAVGGCDANAEGRPRQPWFERGLDLRDPACAGQLEDQLTAIMVEKGEDPEAAAIAASDTLESFFRGKPTLDFLISTRPDWRYYFKIVKKKSGCVLKLYFREKRSGIATVAHPSFASRPLPSCACND
jgi:hypothetical protein